MKVSELYKQVAQLGFETNLENDSRFYYALNRALLQVAKVLPKVVSYTINHRTIPNLLGDQFTPVLKKGNELVFEVNTPAKAVYFECDGKSGDVVAISQDNNGEWSESEMQWSCTLNSLNGEYKAYSGIFRENKPVRLIFKGDYSFYVRNVALYEYVFSNIVRELPAYEAFTKYDMRDRVKDFLSFAAPPITEADAKRMNQGYEIESDSTIILPHGDSGCYTVRYIKKPSEIAFGVGSNDERTIDLSDELCSILPLLVASYVLLEDSPDMAGHYLMQYNERVAYLERDRRNYAPVNIYNANGW
jgi:hypothetical protein